LLESFRQLLPARQMMDLSDLLENGIRRCQALSDICLIPLFKQLQHLAQLLRHHLRHVLL